MATTQPIRTIKETKALAQYFLDKNEPRNYVLVVIAMQTGLRISDILKITWEQVYDYETNKIRKTLTLTEQKTNKTKIIALGKKVAKALKHLAKTAMKSNQYLIENPRTKKPISRIQAYRIIRKAAEALTLRDRVSCHSLRKTFGYHALRSGASHAVIMDIFNHSSFEVTKRYLGISQDDKDIVYLNLELVA